MGLREEVGKMPQVVLPAVGMGLRTTEVAHHRLARVQAPALVMPD